MRRFPLFFAVALCLVPLASLAGLPRVVIREVEVFNAPELVSMAPGLRNMLASRIDGEGYQVVTTGEPGPDGWSVTATVTHLGSIYSVDASLTPVEGARSGERSYQTVRDPEALPGALDKIARVLKGHLTKVLPGGSPGVAAASPTPEPVPPTPTAPPVIAAPPPPAATPGKSPSAVLAEALKSPRKGPAFPGAARSLTVADVDGDGHDEILVLLDDEIVAFRDDGVELRQLWSVPAPSGLEVATISAGDVDADGTPEVFVAGLSDRSPQSQAYVWFGSALSPRGRRISAFVRAMTDRGGVPVLIGRAGGFDLDLFEQGAHTYVWNGSQYERKDRFGLPDNVAGLNFDFVALRPGGEPYLVHTVGKDYLQLVDPSGAVVYTGDVPVKGSRTLFEGEERTLGYEDGEVIRIQGKAVGWKAPGGEPMLLLPVNSGKAARLFGRITSFGQGRILGYRFDGLTLIPEAKGPGLPGFVPDLSLAPVGPVPRGRPTLYVVLIQGSGGLFSKLSTLVLAYDLP